MAKGWGLVARVTGRGCRQLHRSSLVLLKPHLSLTTIPPLDLRYIQTFTAATLPPEAGVPQLLKLLTLPGRATVQVSAATISLMMKTQPALTRSHLLQPLTAPLRDMAAGLSTSEICSDILYLLLQEISLRVSHSLLILVKLWKSLLEVFIE